MSPPSRFPDDTLNRIAAASVDDRLTPLLYDELKRLAARAMRGERDGHTLQTTALVNEAWIRVAGQQRIDPADRARFLGVAAQMMRRVLVDHARRRAAGKRPTSEQRVAIEGLELLEADGGGIDVVNLDKILERLAAISPRQASVIDLKFFAGLELEEIAEVLGVARPTIVRDWRMARAWLQRELADA